MSSISLIQNKQVKAMHFRTRGDKGVELSLPSDSEWTAVNEQYITGEHFFF